MKKGYLVFAVLVSVLLINGQTCERDKEGEGVFIGGKEGLVITFVEDAPPLSGNFRNQEFPIEVDLVNKGETDVAQGSAHVYLTGALYSSEAVLTTLERGQTTNDVPVSAIEEGEGGVIEDRVIVSLGRATYEGEILGDSVPLDARVSVCYPYQTKIQVDNFCVPSTVRKATGTQECTVDNSVNIIEDNANSGAPVHVSSLREQEGPDFIRVTLDINNVGSGDVVGGTCARDIQREELNEVKVTMPSSFECVFKDPEDANKNIGVVELRNGHGVLRCTKPVSNPGNAFEETLNIKLNYNYIQEASKTITINKA